MDTLGDPLLLSGVHSFGNIAMKTQSVAWLLVRLLIRTCCVLGFVISAIIGILWYFQEKLLFYPASPAGYQTPDKNPYPYQTPAQSNMTYEDVSLRTADGVSLHAWFIHQGSKKSKVPTLIFFQGNAGNMGFRLPNISGLYETCGVNILAIHYRGYGYSEGIPNESGLYLDAEAALDWLLQHRQIDRSKIFLFGRSIGGAVAIELAIRRTKAVQGVILENTFTSLEEMVYLIFPILRPIKAIIAVIQRLQMSSIDKINKLELPALFFSGLEDALVPPSHMDRLFDASSGDVKWMYQVPNGKHNDTWQMCSCYYEKINHFIRTVLEGELDFVSNEVMIDDKNVVTTVRKVNGTKKGDEVCSVNDKSKSDIGTPTFGSDMENNCKVRKMSLERAASETMMESTEEAKSEKETEMRQRKVQSQEI